MDEVTQAGGPKRTQFAKAIRWSLLLASVEFGIDTRTLVSRLRRESIAAGDDDKFSTAQICSAIYGDMDGAKLRTQLAIASQEERKDRKEARELIEAGAVVQVWDAALIHLRQVVRHCELSEQKKRDLLDQLKNIPLEEYFKDQKPPDDEQ